VIATVSEGREVWSEEGHHENADQMFDLIQQIA